MRVKGKIGVVTGGATGIGRASAVRLAAEGAVVIVGDVDERRGAEVVDEIALGGGAATFTRLDVTSERDWENLASFVAREYGRVDFLFNNAGVELAKALTEITLGEWEHVMAVNVTGSFLGMKHLIPLMVGHEGGSIVNMSSSSGIIGCGNFSAYTASKGAVRLMTKDAAVEFACKGVRVNSVHPGYVDTDMVERIAGAWNQSRQDIIGAAVPMARMASVNEIANLVLFLVSEEASYCTGAEFVIDGGETAR